ncbi:hypothetical protein MMC29_001332 [Sticta canariensis]|nr:hypothetical protein [Sticta canariensis]
MLLLLVTASFLVLIQVSFVLGHRVIETEAEAHFRNAHIAKSKRSMDACNRKLTKRDAIEKRFSKTDAFLEEHRQARELNYNVDMIKRDFIINGFNSSCILTPESEEGPFYMPGMLIRKDIRETEPGIDLFLDVQITNVNTCEPMIGIYVDFWMANSTGVYSDIESEKTAGQTYLRVLTKFPGYYQGRAQHIHVKMHVNGTILSNNTFSGGSVVHTGQVFFEQSTLTLVNQVVPYSLDPNTITLNSVDGVIQNQGNTTYQSPFVEIRSLGYNISAGFIGIINLAVDPSSVPAAVGVGGGFMNGSGMGPSPSGSGPPPFGSGPPPSGRGSPPSSSGGPSPSVSTFEA